MLPIFYSERFLKHHTGRFHPERPERLSTIVSALRAAPWANQLDWQTPDEQRDVQPWLETVHRRDYIELVRDLARGGGGMLDPDTVVSAGSEAAARLAVAAWLDGVDRAIASREPVFVLVRPPGHHAEQHSGMGFCLFSNAAIAAYYALAQPGIARVAILDWDVHHGNGSQYSVETSPQIAYCSLHQSPCYPGTGDRRERGAHQNVLNLPLPPGSDFATYRAAFLDEALPFLQQFQPDLLLVSAGYDANQADPLASMNLHPEDYRFFTEQALTVTRCAVFGLEGGYDLAALAQSVAATIEGCIDWHAYV